MFQILASSGGFSPEHHIEDSGVLELFFQEIPLLPEIGFGKHAVFMIVSAVICCMIFISMRRKMSLVPSGMAQKIFEPLVIFIRDDIVKKNMPHDYKQFTPFFLTLFFFILFCNLLGLLPWGDTPTASIWVTGALAGLIFILQPIVGMIKQGPVKYWLSFIPGGIPIYILIPLLVILYPIELIGLVTKPFALMIRLYANMMAGHMVLLSILGLIFVFQSWFIGFGIAGGVLCFTVMELGVALLQAYIFTFISSLVLGTAIHPAH